MSLHWPIRRLDDLFHIGRGGSPRPIEEFITEDPSGLNWIKIGDATGGGKYIRSTREKIKRSGLSKTRFVNSGDFLLTNSMSFGQPYILAIDGCIHDGWLVLQPQDNLQIDRDYFYHLLSSDFVYRRFAARAGGSTVKNLNTEIVGSVEVRLPPLDEQRRIAAILDQADALRRKRKRALDLLDSLTRSIFLEMFGDPISNPHAYSHELFGDVGQLDRGVSKHRPRNDPALLNGPHPLIQTGDVGNSGGYIRSYKSTYSDLGLRQSRKWPAGTLCITIAANIAQTGILTFPACFPDSVVGFVHERPGMSEYIRVWLTFLRETLERAAPAVAQKNINLEILRSLKVMMPPYSLIVEFAEVMERLSKLDVNSRALASRYDAMFIALQHRAFSGQL